MKKHMLSALAMTVMAFLAIGSAESDPERDRKIRDEALRYEIQDENDQAIRDLDRAIRKDQLRRGE